MYFWFLRACCDAWRDVLVAQRGVLLASRRAYMQFGAFWRSLAPFGAVWRSVGTEAGVASRFICGLAQFGAYVA